MKSKIDLEKFICSLMKRYYEIHNIDPLTTRCWLDKVLEDQGLEYRSGEIVEIESKDERMRNAAIDACKYMVENFENSTKQYEDAISWLEKQGKKSPFNKERLMEVAKPEKEEEKDKPLDAAENFTKAVTDVHPTLDFDVRAPIIEEKSPAESLGISQEKYEEIVNECIYGSDNEQVSSAKIGKNDTLLDLFHKMPSCITVDGIDYHFVMKKTIAYMAFYEGEGEGSGKVIFWMAGEPIELLTAMLEKLKEEGLLE